VSDGVADGSCRLSSLLLVDGERSRSSLAALERWRRRTARSSRPHGCRRNDIRVRLNHSPGRSAAVWRSACRRGR